MIQSCPTAHYRFSFAKQQLWTISNFYTCRQFATCILLILNQANKQYI